jgi:hypothetical protein
MLMDSRLRWTLAIMVGVLAGVASGSTIATQAQGAERRILQRQDLAGAPGYEVLLV